MIVSEAKGHARRWVLEEGSKLRGLQGAYFTGSVTWLAGDAGVPAASSPATSARNRAISPSTEAGS